MSPAVIDWVKKNKAYTAIIAILALFLVSFLGYIFVVDRKVSDIPRSALVPTDTATDDRTVFSTSDVTSSASASSSAKPAKRWTPSTAVPVQNLTSVKPGNFMLTDPTTGRTTQVVTARSEDQVAADTKRFLGNWNDGANTVPRDAKVVNAPAGVQTYLLLGTDSRNPATDRGRSDSMMLVYVNAAHNRVFLISFPRDTYTNIPGHKRQKINAAYAYGGAPLAVRTVENLTGIRIQHAVVTNFDGFTSMVDAVGGIDIYNPRSWYDSQLNRQWNKGNLHLDSSNALLYVRSRHGLPRGDIDRAANQQRVIEAIITKAMSKQTLAHPDRLLSLIDGVGKNVVLDNSMTNDFIYSTATSLHIDPSQTTRIVAPIKGFANIRGVGSVDILDPARMAALRTALATDNLAAYAGR